MPAVGPQGSRGGLITAVAIFTILFVTATIFAIYFGVDDNKKTDTITQLNAKIKDVYSANDLTDQHYVNLSTHKGVAGQTILESSWHESKQLADVIGGAKPTITTTRPTAVIDDARAAIARAAALPGMDTLPKNPTLLVAMDALTRYAVGQHTQVEDGRNQQTEAARSAADLIKKSQDQVVAKDTELADANKQLQDTLAKQQELADHYQKLDAANQKTMDAERVGFNTQLKKAQTEIESKVTQMASMSKQIEALTTKLAIHRVSVTDPIMRAPDGTIVSVASDDIVYISLGSSDQIVNGMTFEVYDQHEGIPKQDDLMSLDGMPTGVASIEVEHVDAVSSQCRVVHMEIGQHIHQGDLIANLVYDRNTHYKFFVYGDFDLGQTGKAKPGDATKVKALVTQWGGSLQNKIDVDTDFVVLGAEPQMHTFTDEELQDPLNVRLDAEQKKALANYNAQLDNAKQMHIPIMNQNRFLYFCGYYDMAQR